MHFLKTAVFALAFSCSVASLSAQTIQINRENKTIAISTTDEATEVADIAAVNVGFEIFGPDSQSTYSNAGKLSQAILAELHKAGVDDKDIESGGQSLQHNNEFNDKDTLENRAKRQFVFRQNWTVSVAPKNAAEVVRLTIAVGANKTGEIEWRLSNRKELQAKAAATALVKARAVAAQMASGLNVKLGALIYASNETPNTRIFFARPNGMGYGSGGGMGAIASMELAPALEIRPQTIREEATVYAVFAIE